MILFAEKIGPVTSETLSQITAQGVSVQGVVYPLVVESVSNITVEDLCSLIVKLPADQALRGDFVISITFRGVQSNAVVVMINGP